MRLPQMKLLGIVLACEAEPFSKPFTVRCTSQYVENSRVYESEHPNELLTIHGLGNSIFSRPLAVRLHPWSAS